jgi:DNA-binding transcriptional LysR family regulator
MPEFESLLERLIQHEVDFVIVGGFAAMAHGVSLMTEDLDICCPFDEPNLQKLERALAGAHPYHRMTPKRLPFELTPDLLPRLQNLYLRTDLGQIDCLSKVKGLGEYEAVKQQSVAVDLPIGPCRILDIDALIRAKEAIGGTRDLQTVTQLKAIKERKGKAGSP